MYFNKNTKFYFHIYPIRKIRKFITFKTFKSIVTSIVVSSLDYSNMLPINRQPNI